MGGNRTIRVLLAEDWGLLREGLRALLERQPGVDVVGEASTGPTTVTLARALRPDVVMMDVCLPELDGVQATRVILEDASPSSRVLALSMRSDRACVLAMLHAGATGYLLKQSSGAEMMLGLHAVAEGRSYLSPAVARMLEAMGDDAEGESDATNAAPRGRTDSGFRARLTARQLQVLQLLAEGATSKAIAAHLEISVPTVETYRRQLMARLGLHTVADLTKFALRVGLTALDK